MPLGGGVESLQTLVENPVSPIFRFAGVQFRSLTTGRYTGSWTDISPYVIKWGSLELAVDDVRFNSFTDKGISLVVNNDNGAFNHHSNAASLWYGTLTRYRTLLRVQAGYYDTDMSTQVPANSILGIFVLDQEISIDSSSNQVQLRASSLKSVFDQVVVTDIGGIFNVTLTADAIIGKMRDYTDGSGVFVFREFITSTAWSITAGVHNYVLTTDLAANMSAWDIMDKLAESEGYVIMINRTGGIEFRPRQARQSTSQFSFYGQNFPRPSIMQINELKEAWDKYFNYYQLKFLPVETSTSFVHAGTTTIVNPSNPSWFAGARTYQFENTFPSDTATAQSIVNSLFGLSASTVSSVPIEISFDATFIPGLEVMDRVDVSYRSYDLANNALWDVMIWDTDKWGQEGVNFDLNSTLSFITAVKTDLDQLTTNFTVRII
jgi:hypothetical protein